MKNIYLCGFMGCGKTTVGKELAKMLGYRFVDMDDLIVRRTGRTIPQIFEESGEAAFRRYETQLLEEYNNRSSNIVSTGGGALVNPKNVEIASKNGLIFFLDANFELCYQRIHLDKNRPNAASRTKQELYELYELRRPLYLSASTHQVDADNSPIEVAKNIISLVKIK